jgi:predicted ATPase
MAVGDARKTVARERPDVSPAASKPTPPPGASRCDSVGAMIERITIQNYKCLRDVSVDLAPFTVLIGPNDSGKSSLLDAIVALGRPSSEMLEGGSTRETLVWRGERTRSMQWKVEAAAGNIQCRYELSLPVNGPPENETLLVDGTTALLVHRRDMRTLDERFIRDFGPYDAASARLYAAKATPQTQPLIDAFTASQKYRLDPTVLHRTATPSPKPSLSHSGDNLAAVLDALITGPDRDAITKLEADLRAAVPTLRGVALRTVSSDAGFAKALDFVLAGSGPRVTIPASQASEGALLLTAFLALIHGESPEILLIEEPENGLHPSRLKLVIELLRRISTGEVGGRPRQVIVTTHSPILLNYARPEEVRVVQRDPEQGTYVRALTDAPDLPRMLEEFAVGELWYMLGEEGLFARKAAT